ncbi:MAG: histidine kinase [Chitinophagaceae bacterium]
MIFRPVILLLFLGCFAVRLPAQDRPAGIGSLPPAYQALDNDKDRMIFLMNAISDSLNEGQLSRVLEWSRIGLQLAKKNDIDSLKGIFLFDIGKAYTYQYNKYDSAIYYYRQVLPYFPDKLRKYNVLSVREIMDRYADLGKKDSSFAYMDMLKALIDTMPDTSPRKATLSQNIAVVYQGFGMYRTAIRYFQVAINGNKLNKNLRGLGLAQANLGELYNQTGDIEKAIAVSREALQNLADVNMPYMQTASNIADFYISAGHPDSAMKYLELSNRVVEKIQDNESAIANRSILAKIYLSQKKYTAAAALLDKALSSLKETDNSWELCRALLSYADLDSARHDPAAAKTHLEKVIALSRQNQFAPFTLLALEKIAAVCASTGDYREAYRYQSAYLALKDSTATDKARADLNDLEISYKMLQKEQEISLLKKDNDIKGLQVKNANRARIGYLLTALFLVTLVILVYYQRNRRQQAESQRMRAELETKVLQAQMNPHFIFNSLNSIENFIMMNEKRLASDYLNKFATLIRMILDSSRNELVPVSKDMEALQLYIDLEQLRFNNKFTCQVQIDPVLLNGDYRVPSLLIQPYVENAIVHGLAHSRENDLRLSITATLENDKIRYTIQDNGVGREKSIMYNLRNKPQHKSVGLKITEDRVKIFNEQVGGNGGIKFTDLYDGNRQPAGTKVEITIKAV